MVDVYNWYTRFVLVENFVVLRNTIKMEGEFTASEASRMAGFLKPWMLNHLEREGIFVRAHFDDRRSGRVRKYTFGDVLILRAINRMLEVGARPKRIGEVIRSLTTIEAFASDRDAAVLLAKTLGVRLFVGKNEAFLMRNENEVVDLANKGQLSFGFMLDLELIARPVCKVVELYNASKTNNEKSDLIILEQLCASAGI